MPEVSSLGHPEITCNSFNSNELRGIVRALNATLVAFTIELNYKKRVLDLASGRTITATTWEASSTGTHGRIGSAFIMQHVSEDLDRFLAEYLRVNEPACGGP